jgi:Fur family ferric uptake transcriptional regulator
VTRTERAVLTILSGAEAFVSAQELHARLRAAGGTAGLSSVYRALRALEQAGEVDARTADDGETRYRRCQTAAHHHHLVCTHCGTTVELSAPAVESWARRTALQHGFQLDAHTVELAGRCAGCAEVGRV